MVGHVLTTRLETSCSVRLGGRGPQGSRTRPEYPPRTDDISHAPWGRQLDPVFWMDAMTMMRSHSSCARCRKDSVKQMHDSRRIMLTRILFHLRRRSLMGGKPSRKTGQGRQGIRNKRTYQLAREHVLSPACQWKYVRLGTLLITGRDGFLAIKHYENFKVTGGHEV